MKRNFVLLDPTTMKDTESIFTGASPAVAAKKAATRGVKKIFIRETGTEDIHEYKGSVKKLKSPKKVLINGTEVVYTKESSATKVRKYKKADMPVCKM
jgi:hypothetical protein